MPVADMFWGDRYGVIVDPFGRSWSIATHIRDMSPEEIPAGYAELHAVRRLRPGAGLSIWMPLPHPLSPLAGRGPR
jgi:hypothetical protein